MEDMEDSGMARGALMLRLIPTTSVATAWAMLAMLAMLAMPVSPPPPLSTSTASPQLLCPECWEAMLVLAGMWLSLGPQSILPRGRPMLIPTTLVATLDMVVSIE